MFCSFSVFKLTVDSGFFLAFNITFWLSRTLFIATDSSFSAKSYFPAVMLYLIPVYIVFQSESVVHRKF